MYPDQMSSVQIRVTNHRVCAVVTGHLEWLLLFTCTPDTGVCAVKTKGGKTDMMYVFY